MTVEKMRELIVRPYHSPAWQYAVSKMRDSQVVAIYYSLKKRGKLDKPKKKKKEEGRWVQMTLFDYDKSTL